MDWVGQAAGWIREPLTRQAWLDAWQTTIAATPDWALLAAGPGFVLLLAVLLWAQAPRGKRATRHTEPNTSPSKPQAEAKAETTVAPALAAASSVRETPQPAATTTPAASAQPTRRAAQTEAQARTLARRASGVPEENEQEHKARVFLSSTFRDMRGEREVLATDTFPALKRKFRARGVEVQEVDLRWGVNEGDPTLDICLAAVERSNWFVGLIGQRYGTTEGDKAKIQRLAERFPSIREGLGRSLTELEILEGVLANGPGDKHVLFFERDRAWLDKLGPRERPDYEEQELALQAKLADLKARIRAKTGAMHAYASPKDIGAAFEATITEALEIAFPPIEGADDPFMQEHRLHAAYARERLGLYVGGEHYLDDLDAWMLQEAAPPKIAVGASGGGKSTLIAHWTSRWARAHPNDVVFAHYLGASPDSADPAALIRRLWIHLNRITGDHVAIPSPDTELDDLREQVSDRLAQAVAFAAREKCFILIAIDGLDKLADEHCDLRWWPRALSPRIKVLASSLGGKARDVARERNWSELVVKPFDAAQQSAFIADTLKGWNKSDFPEARKRRVLGHALAGLPLFLKTILEELRVSVTNHMLDQRLDDYLKATKMPDLFKRILVQVETECGHDLVAKALSLIWAGRAGLEEDEIVAIAGATSLAWERLRNRLADALRDHRGRMAFAHDYLRQAVEDAFLHTDAAKCAAHLDIANRLEARVADQRQAEELPYQLRQAAQLGEESAWTRLEKLLLDLDRFELLRQRGDGELLSYWLALSARGRNFEPLLCGALETRAGAAERWSRDDAVFAFALDSFFDFAGTVGPSRRRLAEWRTDCLERLAAQNPDSAQAQRDLQVSLNNLGNVAMQAGDLATARARYEQYNALCEPLAAQNPDGAQALRDLTISFHKLGNVAMQAGDLATARARYEQYNALCERLAAQNPNSAEAQRNLTISFHKLGEVAMEAGDLAAARGRYEQSLAVRERRAQQNPDSAEAQRDLSGSLNSLGDVAREAGDLAAARARYEQYNALCERLAAQNPASAEAQRDLSGSLNNLGNVAMEVGDLEAARARYEQSLALRERLAAQNPDSALALRDLSFSFNNLGNVAMEVGDLEAARSRYDQSLAVRERLAAQNPESAEAQRDLSISFNKLGNVAMEAGDLAAARGRYEQSLAVRERLAAQNPESAQVQRDLSISFTKLGDVARQGGDSAQAIEWCKKASDLVGELARKSPEQISHRLDLIELDFRLVQLGNDQAGIQAARKLFEALDASGASLGGHQKWFDELRGMS